MNERIGILSDTHGQAELAQQAAAILTGQKLELVFHCGDIGDLAVVDALACLPMVYVFGNVDLDRSVMWRYIESLGGRVGEPLAECELAGRQIAAIHGDDAYHLKDLIDSQRYDCVLHGHTHLPRDEHIGRTHVLNPGALYRVPEPHVLVLNVRANRVRRFRLPGKSR